MRKVEFVEENNIECIHNPAIQRKHFVYFIITFAQISIFYLNWVYITYFFAFFKNLFIY